LDKPYINVLRRLYAGQHGVLGQEARFPIERGVRQGDVLSPVLFNSVLEEAVADWKRKLIEHGLALTPKPGEERLTNIRYADDLLLFAKSLPEASEMIELLVASLKDCGLELNSSKTKIMTTASYTDKEFGDALSSVECLGGSIDVLMGDATHKYLGRKSPGDLKKRAQEGLQYRMQCAWTKYRQLRQSLKCSHVNLRLRLRLFDAVISPTVLYGLETISLTSSQVDRLDAMQRKMLRGIVGWVNRSGESWEEAGRRMKSRLANAMAIYPVPIWSECLGAKKNCLSNKIATGSAPKLTCDAARWSPKDCQHRNALKACGKCGRPQTRWNDRVH
jgi:hypothetical protein